MDSIEGKAASIANRFLTARREARGLADYPGAFPESLEEAYRIQDAAIARWAKPVLGWKVGRVPPALVEQFGTDRLAGPIFAVTIDGIESGIADMPVFASGFAAGEAEYLLRIGAAPPPGQRKFTLDEAARLIDAVHVGIEIASSPLKTINDLGPIAVVSDFGNNNGLLVGPPIDDWPESLFEQWPVVTLVDGVEVGGGTASAFPDGAMGSARFLFKLMAERGIALEAGQWISTGAVTGVHDARPGSVVEAWFGDCHHLACRLVAEKGQ
ncbi:MAG: 2-keto-4-pentenoate hydratase [Pseudomonadota bacterium]|nr:2-keto-4-pentenoate hydratase [Pseudomonadota bacterium]